MNRFFRSGLLPLILIVLVVYLASTQLMNSGKNEKRVTLSESQADVQNNQVSSTVFNPNKQSISFELSDNTKGSVHYPSEQSVPGITRQLADHGVKYDSKGVGSSAWWSILTGLLPFVLLFGFWLFLMNQLPGG